jgi:hypothetical protein
MIDFFRYIVVGEIQACRHYLDAMESAVPPAHERALADMRRQAEAESWHEDDYESERQGIDGVYTYTLPEVLCSSLLIYLHSRIEVQLGVVARDLRQRQNLKLQVTELSGSPIDRVRVYLTKVANVPVQDLPGWTALRDLAKIRDVLVHRGGQLGADPSEREKLRQLALRYPGLLSASIGWAKPDSELRFGSAFCRRLIDAAEELFEALLNFTRP